MASLETKLLRTGFSSTNILCNYLEISLNVDTFSCRNRVTNTFTLSVKFY